MGRTSDAREKLLQVAFDLIWENSYSSVSVDDICERAQVKKGSFYHFFPSKCDLALAAIDAWVQTKRPMMDAVFSPSVPPLERLRTFCDFVYRDQKRIFEERGHVLGCPFASLGCEMSTQEERLRAKTSEITGRMLNYLESAIAEAQRLGQIPAGDPRDAARLLHSLKTGMITEAKIHNDPECLAGMADAAFRLLGVRTGQEVAA
jgi:TetR/AcrR family transcriptional repressor of nem operon